MTFTAGPNGNVSGQTGDNGELLPSISIANLLNQRQALHEIIEQIAALLARGDELARNAGFGTFSDYADRAPYTRHRHAAHFASAHGREAVENALDAQGWKTLLNDSGVRTFMSAAKREEWDKAIHNAEVPPLTRESIAGTFAQLYESREDMFDDGVVGVFRKLSWCHKTNNPVKFGKKIICNSALTKFTDWVSVSHPFGNELDDLMRVFTVVDGKAQPDHRQGSYIALSDAIKNRTNEYANEYIHVRLFRSACTAHITFQRADLVERLNAILARRCPGALPPARK